MRGYASPTWFSYSVLGGWSAVNVLCLGCGNLSLVQDGATTYYSSITCWFAAFDTATGAALPCAFSSSGPIVALAATGCGGFHAGQRGLSLARFGNLGAIPFTLLNATVDHLAIAGSFLYFHSQSDNAIGKLPLP